MAAIYLTTTSQPSDWNPLAMDNFNLVRYASERSIDLKHTITESPEEADIILFVGSRRYYQSDILDSELYKKYYRKSLIIDFQDITIPRLPGIYVNIPRYLHKHPIYEYGFYLRVFTNELLIDRPCFSQCKYLYSFIGSSKTCPSVRERVLHLTHPRAYLQDSFSKNSGGELYVDIMQSSKFILCPRGFSASSFRVFETMRSSRVPVIIADEWIPPAEIEWDKFSIRVAEKDIDSIPSLLESMEPQAEVMGQKALACWQANFSAETSFGWIANAAVRIQSLRQPYQKIVDRSLVFESLKKDRFTTFWKEFILRKLGKI